MPQMQLPVFSEGVTHITPELAFEKRDGRITYFNGQMPIFVHDEDDIQTFRMITSQFVENGNVKQVDIIDAFGVPKGTVKRYCKVYREKGPAGFYAPKRGRGASILKPPVLQEVQDLLDQGVDVPTIGRELDIHADTLHKAIKDGRLHRPVKKRPLSAS